MESLGATVVTLPSLVYLRAEKNDYGLPFFEMTQSRRSPPIKTATRSFGRYLGQTASTVHSHTNSTNHVPFSVLVFHI